MSEVLKREVVYVLTAIVCVIMFVEYFFFTETWQLAENLRTYATIIANLAIGLGGVTLVISHTRKVQRRTPGVWVFSAWLLIFLAISLLTGLAGWAMTGSGSGNTLYDWFFRHVYTPLGQHLYPITGFYIFSAAYRAFRARNIDSALLLIAGCFVILTNAPAGGAIWSGFPIVGRWFLDYGQVPGMRTFLIVGSLGMLAYGFRALLGRERGFYGEVSRAE